MVQAFGGDQKRKVRLVFQDEAGFGRISDLRNRWAPEKMRPDVKNRLFGKITLGISLATRLTRWRKDFAKRLRNWPTTNIWSKG